MNLINEGEKGGGASSRGNNINNNGVEMYDVELKNNEQRKHVRVRIPGRIVGGDDDQDEDSSSSGSDIANNNTNKKKNNTYKRKKKTNNANVTNEKKKKRRRIEVSKESDEPVLTLKNGPNDPVFIVERSGRTRINKNSLDAKVKKLPPRLEPGEYQWNGKDMKRGRYSEREWQLIDSVITEEARKRGIAREEVISDLVQPTKLHNRKNKWQPLTDALPWRSYNSLFISVRRHYSDTSPFTEEEDRQLKALVEIYGESWSRISREMDRDQFAVRDRYRALKRKVEMDRVGRAKTKVRWTPDDSLKLVQILRRMYPGPNPPEVGEYATSINWATVKREFGGKFKNITSYQHHYVHHVYPVLLRKEWYKQDEVHMIQALINSGEESIRDVVWDDVLEKFDGASCREHFRAMTRRLPSGEFDFVEKLVLLKELLASPQISAVLTPSDYSTFVDESLSWEKQPDERQLYQPEVTYMSDPHRVVHPSSVVVTNDAFSKRKRTKSKSHKKKKKKKKKTHTKKKQHRPTTIVNEMSTAPVIEDAPMLVISEKHAGNDHNDDDEVQSASDTTITSSGDDDDDGVPTVGNSSASRQLVIKSITNVVPH